MSPAQREFAKELRHRATPSERIAWEALRSHRCHGLKFRRQHFIAGYFVDFYCPALRLVVEIDGASHDDVDSTAKDVGRALALRRAGVLHQLHVRPNEVTNLRNLIKPYTDAFPSPGGRGVRGEGQDTRNA
jgi:very-short-patch-repair endonuclease